MKHVLITGGDGYLGSRLAHLYLEAGDHQVVLWVHARNTAERAAKQQLLAGLFGERLAAMQVHYGELRDEAPFAGIATGPLTHIVHGAAVIHFNVAQDTARQVNVEGSRKLLDFARRCPNLERVALLSSLYASGLDGGQLAEDRFFPGRGHANHYEWSKWAAEELLFTAYRELPWQILRVGTLVADDERGGVSQYNAVHNTLKLFFYGLLSVVPGLAGTPLYLSTGEFAARTAFAALHNPQAARVVHLSHARGEALSLASFIDLAFEEFTADPRFTARRVLKPLYADLESFNTLSRTVNQLAGSAVTQALGTVSPFAAQLFVDKDFETRNLTALRLDQAAPAMDTVLRATCRHLVQTQWGKS